MAQVDNGLQGADVEFMVREAGSSDVWRRMVCSIDDQFELTNETTETDTKCGTYIGIKPVKANISGNAVFNTEATGSEVSYEDVTNWQINNTPMEFIYRNEAYTSGSGSTVAAGDVLYFTGAGYFSATMYNGTNGQIGQFSWTFKPNTVTNVHDS
jgi:hypothetical protein